MCALTLHAKKVSVGKQISSGAQQRLKGISPFLRTRQVGSLQQERLARPSQSCDNLNESVASGTVQLVNASAYYQSFERTIAQMNDNQDDVLCDFVHCKTAFVQRSLKRFTTACVTDKFAYDLKCNMK